MKCVREPLILPAIAFAAGIWFSAGSWWAILACSVAAVFIQTSWMRQICLLCACFLVGGLVSSRQPAPKEPELDAAPGEVLLLSGCIVGPVSSDGIQARFPVELEAGADAHVTLTARPGESLPLLEYGQRIEVEAKVRKPKNFGNPGAFDFVGYLAASLSTGWPPPGEPIR